MNSTYQQKYLKEIGITVWSEKKLRSIKNIEADTQNFSLANKLLDETLSYKNMFNYFAYHEFIINRTRGELFLYQGDYNNSLEAYKKAEEFDVKADRIIFEKNRDLGKIYYYLEDFSEAKKYLENARKLAAGIFSRRRKVLR